MESSSYIFGSKNFGKRLPKAFIMSLVLVMVTETFIGLLGPFLNADPAPYFVRAQLKIAHDRIGKKDILIFGDSCAQSVFDTKVIQEYTSLTCYNFSLFRGVGLAGNYFLFDAFLECNPPPKFIILMFVHDGWKDEGTYFFDERVEKLRKEGIIKNVHERFSLDKFIDSVIPSKRYCMDIRRFVKSFKFSVRALIEAKKKLDSTEQILRLDNGNSSDFMEKSYYVKPSIDSVMGDMLVSESLIANKKFIPSSINMYFLKKFIKRAQENNIMVLISFSPLYEGFYERPQNREYLEAHRLFLHSIVDHYKNVRFLNDDYYIVGADKLIDSIYHLNHEESLTFILKFAKEILKKG